MVWLELDPTHFSKNKKKKKESKNSNFVSKLMLLWIRYNEIKTN